MILSDLAKCSMTRSIAQSLSLTAELLVLLVTLASYLSPILRSDHYLMLYISETVRETDIVSMEC